MNLEYSHKPNYFLYAQLMIHHIKGYIEKHPDTNHAVFDLRDVYQVFREDLASSTTNLDGILNIADEYSVDTLNGDQKIIASYKINADNNTLALEFHPDAVAALNNGAKIIEPDATLHG